VTLRPNYANVAATVGGRGLASLRRFWCNTPGGSTPPTRDRDVPYGVRSEFKRVGEVWDSSGRGSAFLESLTPASVAAWLGRFAEGWQRQDTDTLVDLFTRDGSFWETPFGPPEAGSEAMRQGWDDLWPYQRDGQMHAEVLAVEGNAAVARWWATYTRLPDHVYRELDGILLLRFSDDGRCRELIEWRHARDDGVVMPT
jgi:ketosteroid isomerase-like protein